MTRNTVQRCAGPALVLTIASVAAQHGTETPTTGHWAFAPPGVHTPPEVRDAAWPNTAIDRFVLAALEAESVAPVDDATPHELIRRVYFDLTGLPPTPAQVAAFVADPSAAAFADIVDELLASRRFAERWGRHWLDVARYGESSGKERNLTYPHAWRYRDWVIDAFDADKPYDRFLAEQIAGDLLPADTDEQRAQNLIATGYLAIGPKSHNERNKVQFRLDVADEQIDTLTRGVLGVTVSCARCHDHKFDPISQRDYTAMAGIFLSTDTRFGTARTVGVQQTAGLLELPDVDGVETVTSFGPRQVELFREQLERARSERGELLAEARRKNPGFLRANRNFLRLNNQIALLEARLRNFDRDGRPRPIAMGVKDRLVGRDSPLYERGERDKAGARVPRGVVAALCGSETPEIDSGSGRLELAQWIASTDNPLTARVFVNRVWKHLLGRAIVPTTENFGTTGGSPSHPELLDWLAHAFIDGGWSTKALIRTIVTSRVYRLGTTHADDAWQSDPDNRLLWRQSARRLDAEALRDSMLMIAGSLDLTPAKGSLTAYVGPGDAARLLAGQQRRAAFGFDQRRRDRGSGANRRPRPPSNKRSVYLPIVRDQLPEELALFDFAEPSLVVGDREETTVPSQALFLMNSAFVRRAARGFATRLLRQRDLESDERIALAFQLAYSREATSSEAAAAHRFITAGLESSDGSPRAARDVWSAFCQALFAAAEFRYLS